MDEILGRVWEGSVCDVSEKWPSFPRRPAAALLSMRSHKMRDVLDMELDTVQ